MTVYITDLCVELLLQIFEYCDIETLCRLRQCCRKFNLIINHHKLDVKEENALVTNQVKNTISERSFLLLNGFEKWRISKNWKIGRYKSYKFLEQRVHYMPWLHLEKLHFWMSLGKYIKCYQRTKHNVLKTDVPVQLISVPNYNEDIVKFKIRDAYIIAGLRQGGLWVYSRESQKVLYSNLASHLNDVTAVDITNNVFISGSSDKSFSAWSYQSTIDTFVLAENKMIHDRILSLQICPNRKYIAIGTGGFYQIPPFHLYDLERLEPIHFHRFTTTKGAGALDLHWDNENTVLSCGYDTNLRKIDVRIGKCVQCWSDPLDAAIICLSSDDLYSVLAGSMIDGRITLWDQRVSRKHVQIYFPEATAKRSPVYSITFDSTQLFTALDRNICCLDFSVRDGVIKNYEGFFR